MENEKQNKENKAKKTILEAFYWSGLGLCLIWAFICGISQAKQMKDLNNKLNAIEEKLSNKEKSALAREEVRRALPLRDSSNIEDLSGSTWLINSNPNMINNDYHINFICNEENYYGIGYGYFGLDDDLTIEYATNSGWTSSVNVYYYDNWVSEEYRTISIIDGSDSSSTGLISWLSENALQQENPELIEPLTGLDFSLSNRYDFRKWFGNVDPLTGCIQYNSTTQQYYDIGSLKVGGNEYKTLAISFQAVNNSINIITGYDFQNSCYLAIGGADYYGGSNNGHVLITAIDLIDTASYPATNKLKLYEVPLVGARMQYESGNPISPSDYITATGYLCSTFELNEKAINWTNYIPSSSKYNFPGIGENFSVYEVLQLDLLNDTYLDFYSISASATGGNVFDLIGNAFKCITNLASIQVIPGISLGLLVVLPITATIIIVVVKLVRK